MLSIMTHTPPAHTHAHKHAEQALCPPPSFILAHNFFPLRPLLPFPFLGFFLSLFSSSLHLFCFSFRCPFISITHESTLKRIDRCLTFQGCHTESQQSSLGETCVTQAVQRHPQSRKKALSFIWSSFFFLRRTFSFLVLVILR